MLISLGNKERIILEMHICIAHNPRKHHLLPIVREVEFRHCTVLRNDFSHLLMRTLIFIVSRTLCELAHIFHSQLFSFGSAVDTPCDITQRSIAKAQKSVGNSLYLR